MIQWIDMTRKVRTFVYVFRNSLLNFNYYHEAAKTDFFFSLKYFFGLLTLTSFVSFLPLALTAVFFLPKLPATVTQVKSFAEKAIPPSLVMTVKNGEVSTNVFEPYYVDAPNIKGHLAVIDTTANPSDYGKYDSYFLVTKSALVSSDGSRNDNSPQVIPIKDLTPDGTINHDSYLRLVRSFYPALDHANLLTWALIVFLFTLGPVLAAAVILPFKLLHLTFVSAIFQVFFRMSGKRFSFGEIYKMAMHASTLPITFFALLSVFGLYPTFPFGYSLILGTFLIIIFLHLKPKP